MAFFMLFNLSKETDYHHLKKQLSVFGKINFFKLTNDIKNNNFKFGQIDYNNMSNKEGLIEFFKAQKIRYVEKQSTQQIHKKTTNEPRPEVKSISSIVSNPSFHFYKDKAYGKGIENFQFQNSYTKLFEINDAKTLELTTNYPGLLVGSGYNHPKLKENTDDFQLGFFFDHTTGLPLINGSSIKGMLRSVFKNRAFMKDVYDKDVNEDLFEDNQTVFYDAFIVKSNNDNKRIFGSDYITSHKSDEPNGVFDNPNPIKFLKILPEVTFRFQFKCTDEQLDLFKQVILDFGLGAKTNTGYGKFKEV